MDITDSRLRSASIGRALKSVVLACIFTLTSSSIVAFSFRRELKGFDPGFSDLDLIGAVVQAGILGPAIESLLAGGVISIILLPLFRYRTAVIVVSAVIFSSLHAIFNVYWGIVVFFPFVVYSYLFLSYMKYGRRWAYGMSFLAHAVHNSCAVLAVFLVDSAS
nr:hypothetical protein [Pseudoxanthomonas sp.]